VKERSAHLRHGRKIMPAKGFEPKKRSIPPRIILLVAFVVALVGGWSLFWYVASRKTESVLTAWMEREAQAGRNWICLDRRIAGYPLEVEVSCANPLFQGEILGKKFTATLKGFRAAAPLLRPETLIAELQPPFSVKANDGTLDVALQWANLNIELAGRPDQLSRASAVGEQVTLQGKIGDIDAVAGGAGNFHAYAIVAPDRHDRAYDFRVALNDASIPALDSGFGLQPPLSIAFVGVLTQAVFSGAGTLEQRIEGWRTSGGYIDLKTVHLSGRKSEFEAGGKIDLDDAHRVRGKLDATITGLGTLLRRLNVDPGIVAASSLVTSFLSKRNPDGSGNGGASRMPVPVTIADGWLSIGPIRTPVRFPPLY
jgi:hypothetical protein